MEYISTKEASAKWGISTIRITILANEGRIPGAQRLGRSWLIPANATKPPELKAKHSASAKKKIAEANSFSFPLYHFRPDWSYLKEEQLTEQQKCLLAIETAVLECRFADAYPLLQPILNAPDDIITEMGALWNAGICCIGLNRPADFSKIYLRLQILLSEDFPHRDDLAIILDTLKTYVEPMETLAKNDDCNTDIHDQCFPLMCLQHGYSLLCREALNPGSTDVNFLEINLRFFHATSAVFVVEMMHIYLLGIYYMRQDMESAIKHAKVAVKIAYENKIYFPLVTYYRYFDSVLSSILKQYPEEFQKQCQSLISQYEENFTAFLSSMYEFDTFSKLTNTDYPYIYAVLMNLSNHEIADKFGVTSRTVIRKLESICKILGVKNKSELKDYLHKNM